MGSLQAKAEYPPPAPLGYVLWQKQTLRDSTDAWGRVLPAHWIEEDGWRFVRVEDLASGNELPRSISPSPRKLQEQESHHKPERLAKQAMVKEYVFTGSRETDVKALQGYVQACNEAIRALDPADGAARTLDRLKLRMEVTIVKESLKEELEILTEEIYEDGYFGFQSGAVDDGLIRWQMRPKGYRWAGPRWL